MFGFFKKTLNFVAPVSGKTIELSEVNDVAFAQKMVGDGVAIQPTSNIIVAPCNGTLSLIMETNHAFAITLDNGVEMLVHVGLDTVSLNGKGFKVLANVGESVTAGTPILEIDKEYLDSMNIDLTTPVLIANVDFVKEIKALSGKIVTAGKDVVLEYKI